MAEDSALEAQLTHQLSEGQRTEPMLQFFHFSHLPPQLRSTSLEFAVLALTIESRLPRNAERTVALRKLMEAKDCAVRAQLFVASTPPAGIPHV